MNFSYPNIIVLGLFKSTLKISTILKFLRILGNGNLFSPRPKKYQVRNLKVLRNFLFSLCFIILKCIIVVE